MLYKLGKIFSDMLAIFNILKNVYLLKTCVMICSSHILTES